MKDLEYVKAVLATNYDTAHPHELPYPELDEVIGETSFEFLEGVVDGETPNGSKSREGHDYLWFKHGKKSILSHRFIAAMTLGKWVPRDFDIDHVNHNPSDNRPVNLRVLTRRDNMGNRRNALLSDLAELEAVSLSLKERKPPIISELVPEPEPVSEPMPSNADRDSEVSFGGPIRQATYTGETKPNKYGGGRWHKTNLGSWHLRFD